LFFALNIDIRFYTERASFNTTQARKYWMKRNLFLADL